MSLRRYLEAARRRQPFASRTSLEATAADLRREMHELRTRHDELRAEVAAIGTELAGQVGRRDADARRAWDELAARTEAWGARLLDLETRLDQAERTPTA